MNLIIFKFALLLNAHSVMSLSPRPCDLDNTPVCGSDRRNCANACDAQAASVICYVEGKFEDFRM
jgi:hypothetical protein